MTNESSALSIGSILGGRTASNLAWREGLDVLGGDVIRLRVGVVSDLNLNVEFHIPGNLWQPEFEGIRTGAFKKAEPVLKVQVALTLPAPDEARPALIVMVRESLVAAERWAVRRCVPFDPEPLRALVDSLDSDRA